MKTLNEAIEQARAALPPCDEVSAAELRIITTIMEPREGSVQMESHMFTITFRKLAQDGSTVWELADVETRSDVRAGLDK